MVAATVNTTTRSNAPEFGAIIVRTHGRVALTAGTICKKTEVEVEGVVLVVVDPAANAEKCALFAQASVKFFAGDSDEMVTSAMCGGKLPHISLTHRRPLA